LEIEKYIKIYDDFINYKTLSVFLKFVNCQDFEDAGINETNKVNKNIRNTLTKKLSFTSESLTDVHWNNYLTNKFFKSFYSYCKEHNHCSVDKLETIEILKYEQGGCYVEHTDHFDARPRTLSGIFFLNNDYEGGELVFNFDNRDYIIEKKPNRFIVWPSNFLFPHRVNKVTKGVRYSVVTWIL
tara:strand:+ start:288 stop:839 length:552 start_codon:yes stop_codon:yes gene_type:complete